MKSVFEKYLSNTPKYANQIQIQIQIFHLVVFQIQIQIQIQIFAYLNTNTNTNTYLTPALASTISKWTVTQSQRVPSVTPLFLICQSTVTINDCVCNVNIWNVNCSQSCNSIHFRLANRYPCRSEGVFVTEYVSPEEESNPILQIQSE